MKKIFTLIALVVIAIGVRATDPIAITVSKFKEDRPVSNFQGVASSGYVDVIIKLGTTESLRLEGDAEAIADLVTEVKDHILVIKPKTKVYRDNRFRTKKVTAYITAKKLSSLTMSGSGEMLVEDQLNTSTLAATLSGSGSIKAKGKLSNFNGVLSGSGTILFSGSASNANVTVSGSGTFSGRDFAISDLSTQVSGSGSVYVNVSGNLNAVISGSGSVNYSGDAVVQKTTVGSGRVRKV